MAPIRKAHRFVTYLGALVVSAIFSLVGRPVPTWADDVKVERSATIFREMLAQGQPDRTGMGVRKEESRAINNIVPLPEKEIIDQAIKERVQGIQQKILNKEGLTDAEAALFLSKQNSDRSDEIYTELKLLFTKLNLLLKMLKGQGDE